MTTAQWLLIGLLAAGTFAIRLTGLLVGDAVERRPALRAVLRDLPGCLVVALVASSLASASPQAWIAAAVALSVAAWSNHVILTMVIGVGAFISIETVLQT